jgi:hypothetical protein
MQSEPTTTADPSMEQPNDMAHADSASASVPPAAPSPAGTNGSAIVWVVLAILVAIFLFSKPKSADEASKALGNFYDQKRSNDATVDRMRRSF